LTVLYVPCSFGGGWICGSVGKGLGRESEREREGRRQGGIER
jgi:hypothetical protein